MLRTDRLQKEGNFVKYITKSKQEGDEKKNILAMITKSVRACFVRLKQFGTSTPLVVRREKGKQCFVVRCR